MTPQNKTRNENIKSGKRGKNKMKQTVKNGR